MKDNFSTQSDKYAKYRPTYPIDFLVYLNSLISDKTNAWDCGTGNGQVAHELAKTFKNVYATDISKPQIDNALLADNIFYSVQPAESTNFNDKQFDLIVVAQAIHWFDFDLFYNEVNRTAKNNALLCVIGYSRIKVSEEIDELITHFYTKIIGSYWDKERKFIDENYTTIPFPFQEVKAPNFVNVQYWSFEQLIGYLNTWSAVKHFINANNFNPVDQLSIELKKIWGENEFKEIKFPLLIRLGKIT